MSASASVDEEALLRAKAALVAKKVHMRNLNLIGVNPSTCKTEESNKLIIGQIKTIKSGALTHCPSVVESVLKPLNDEIAKVDSGVLVYAPLPIAKISSPAFPQTPDYDFQDPVKNNETKEVFQEASVEPVEPEQPIGPTGLNSEDLDRIFSNYEDNRHAYRPSEEDNLFKILSKAYIRNLNRLIQRKKDF